MATRKCKNCNSFIAPIDIAPKESRYRNYVCPVCGVAIRSFTLMHFYILAGILFCLWMLQFFYYHASKGNIAWDQETQISLLIGIFCCSVVTYCSTKLVLAKKNKRQESKLYLYTCFVLALIFLREVYILASRVWGL
jgi:hypothetical protein